MADGCKHIVPLSFADAVAEVRRVERQPQTSHEGPRYSKLLDDAADDLKEEKFWKIKYSYGDLVINKGIFTLPGIDEACPTCREMGDEYIKKKTVPLLLNLDKNLEVFLICTDIHGTTTDEKSASRTVPVSHRTPGEFIGLFESLRPLVAKPAHYGAFYVSAGSRNVHVVLPLQYETSEIIGRLLGRALHSDPLLVLNADDCKQYGLNYQTASQIASHWRLVKRTPKANWEASLLLLPHKIVGNVAGSGKTISKKWTRELLLKLLLEAWGQAQDALEAFVAEDEPHIQGSPYFLNIDDASGPIVLRYLTDCVDGKALLHCPTRKADANGPFQDFLRWAAGITDPEQDYYVPLILEPRRLDCAAKGDFGFVSMIHPLIATSLRFKEREKWGPSKLTANLKRELKTRGIENLIGIHPTDTVKDIKKLGCESIRGLLKDQGVSKIPGKKLARNRCLKIFMKVDDRKTASALRGGSS